MNHRPMLVVHPDRTAAAMLASMLSPLGLRIEEAEDDRAAVRRLCNGPSLLLAGVDPLDCDALELLVYARRKYAAVPVVLLFTGPDAGRADEALRLGAVAVRQFPCSPVELRAVVADALKGTDTRSTCDDRADVREVGEHQVRPIAEGRDRNGSDQGPKKKVASGLKTARAGLSAASTRDGRAVAGARLVPLRVAMEGTERQILLEALRSLDWNRQQAAKVLRIDRTTLYKKLKKYGLIAVDGRGDD